MFFSGKFRLRLVLFVEKCFSRKNFLKSVRLVKENKMHHADRTH
jgi:hypothetical protein